MDFDERSILVRRISSGKSYTSIKYQHDSIDVIFTDPTLDLLVEADFKHQRMIDDLKQDPNLFTREQSYKILENNGSWSPKLEEELKGLRSDLKTLSSNINSLQFHKLQQKALKETINKAKTRIEQLHTIKEQLWPSTIEYMADRQKKRFILKNITTIEDPHLLEKPIFIDVLIVYYYNEHHHVLSKVRELARHDPWRLYWTVSKDTGTPLFKRSSVEMTDLQYALVSWSKVYDFAYDSTNRPSDDVIEDDDKFDAWYTSECERLRQETKKNQINGVGGQEVFVPADREGAKEVYALNNFDAKNRIAQRQEAIIKKGVVKEENLPDVSQDIKLEVNRLASASQRK